MPEVDETKSPLQVKIETLGSSGVVGQGEVKKEGMWGVCLDPKKTTTVQVDEPMVKVEAVEEQVIVEDIGRECGGEREEVVVQRVSLDPLREQVERERVLLSSATKVDDKQRLTEEQEKKEKKKVNKKWWWLVVAIVIILAVVGDWWMIDLQPEETVAATVTYQQQQQQLLDLLSRSWYVMTYVADDEMGQVSVTIQKSGDNYLVQASDLNYEILVRGDEVLMVDHIGKMVRAQVLDMEAVVPYMVIRGFDLSSTPVMGMETVGETTYVTEDYGQVKGYFASGELVYLKNNESGRIYQLRGYKPVAGQVWAAVDDSWLIWPDDYVVSGSVADLGVPVSISRGQQPAVPVVTEKIVEEVESQILIADDVEPDAVVDGGIEETETSTVKEEAQIVPTPVPQSVQTQITATPTPTVKTPVNDSFEGLEVGEYRVIN